MILFKMKFPEEMQDIKPVSSCIPSGVASGSCAKCFALWGWFCVVRLVFWDWCNPTIYPTISFSLLVFPADRHLVTSRIKCLQCKLERKRKSILFLFFEWKFFQGDSSLPAKKTVEQMKPFYNKSGITLMKAWLQRFCFVTKQRRAFSITLLLFLLYYFFQSFLGTPRIWFYFFLFSRML